MVVESVAAFAGSVPELRLEVDVDPVEDPADVRVGGNGVDTVQRNDRDRVGTGRQTVNLEVTVPAPHRQLARDRADLARRAGIGKVEGFDVSTEDGRSIEPAHDRARDRARRGREIDRAGGEPTCGRLGIDHGGAGPGITLHASLPRVPDDEGDHGAVGYARGVQAGDGTVL